MSAYAREACCFERPFLVIKYSRHPPSFRHFAQRQRYAALRGFVTEKDLLGSLQNGQYARDRAWSPSPSRSMSSGRSNRPRLLKVLEIIEKHCLLLEPDRKKCESASAHHSNPVFAPSSRRFGDWVNVCVVFAATTDCRPDGCSYAETPPLFLLRLQRFRAESAPTCAALRCRWTATRGGWEPCAGFDERRRPSLQSTLLGLNICLHRFKKESTNARDVVQPTSS